MARIAGMICHVTSNCHWLNLHLRIGNTTAQKVLAEAGVSEDVRVRDLTSDKKMPFVQQLTS